MRRGFNPALIAAPPLASPGRRRMTHDEALLVARGGELVQLASESSKRIDSTTGAIHVARAFDTHLPERDRAARRLAEDTADAAWARIVQDAIS